MKRRRQVLAILAAGVMALSTAVTGYTAPSVYDYTADTSAGGQTFQFEVETPKVYPGDLIYGPVKVYLGAEKVQADSPEDMDTDASGQTYWKDKGAAVYQVTDLTSSQAPAEAQTEMVPALDEAGNPILNEDGTPALVPSPVQTAEGSSDAVYQLDPVGFVVEAVGGRTSGGEETLDPSASKLTLTGEDGSQTEVDPDARFYAPGSTVTLTADPASDGQVFAGWTVYQLQEDGSLKTTDDLSALKLDGISPETLLAESVTFTMGQPDQVTVFQATYQAADSSKTEETGADQEETKGPEAATDQAAGQQTAGTDQTLPEAGSDAAQAEVTGDPDAIQIQTSDSAIVDPASGDVAQTTDQTDAAQATSQTDAAQATSQTDAGQATGQTDAGQLADQQQAAETNSSQQAAETNSSQQTASGYAINIDETTTTLQLPVGVSKDAVPAGTSVTVAAKPQDGKVFSGWEVEGMEVSNLNLASESLSFQMPEKAIALTAQQTEQKYKLTLNPGAGKADPYTEVTVQIGENPNPTTKKGEPVQVADIAVGTRVTVTLKNTSASPVLTVSGSAEQASSVQITSDSQNPGVYTFNMPSSDVTLTYSAASDKTYLVTVSVQGGQITNDNGTTSGSYLAGTELSLQAQIPDGMRFTGWTLSDPALGTLTDAGATATTLRLTGSLTNSTSLTLTANYQPITYNLTVDSGSGTGQYSAQTPAAITADAPQAGYQFSGWTLVSGSGSFADQKAQTTTFTCSSDARVQANYEPIPYKITVKHGKNSGSYTVGQKVDLEADFPDEGKEFDKWSVTSGKLEVEDKASYYTKATVKASDATVTALYKNGPSADSNAITGLQNDMEYLKSSTLTFQAVGAGMDNVDPNPGDYRFRPTGYQIGSVTGGWSKEPYQTSMAINATGDYTLTVTYAKEVFDGKDWNQDGTTVSRSITLHVVNALSVKTGDNAPLLSLFLLAGGALVVIIVLLAVRKRKH